MIDGKVFVLPELDVEKFFTERIVYSNWKYPVFGVNGIYSIYKRIFNYNENIIELGSKSYIENCRIEGNGNIQIGNFSSISWEILFELNLSIDHVYRYVTNYPGHHCDWIIHGNFYPQHKFLRANLIIGNDIWMGRGCKVKVSNLDKPLIIGDGAVIASDSVVVKDVPPYAIVGGNPAKIIKYRFDDETIERLKRIQWWNWDLEKIYDNFQYFKDPVEFAKRFDIER